MVFRTSKQPGAVWKKGEAFDPKKLNMAT